jgi:hypothetical protein
MIWNKNAINYSKGVKLLKSGIIKPNKIGCYVYTIAEIMELRKIKINKLWLEKAKTFAKYFKDDYNKDRHISATLGSAGYTFVSDIKKLKEYLIIIEEIEIANLINI